MGIDRQIVIEALAAYEVGDELGRGAWGVVLAGRHRQLGRDVAIKQLPRAFGNDPGVKRRFASEARLLASLDHPHIVPVYDFVEHNGVCMLVMELLTGGTVWSRFKDQGFSSESACAVILATCTGLDHAHRQGVLHRDIKPENLMFSRQGLLKVTDFGIAKVLGDSAAAATKTGFALGTPAYIAPEQAEGGDLGPPTDVYAAGTVLYELLAQELPFPPADTPAAALYQRVHTQPRHLLEVNPGVPPTVASVTHHALATDPADRFATAEEFGRALAGAAAQAWGSDWTSRTDVVLRGVEKMTSGGPPAPPRDVTAPVANGSPRSDATQQRVRRWAPPFAAALSLAAIIAIAGVVLGGGDSDKPQADGGGASPGDEQSGSGRPAEGTAAPARLDSSTFQADGDRVGCRYARKILTCSLGNGEGAILGAEGRPRIVRVKTPPSGGPRLVRGREWQRDNLRCDLKQNGLSCYELSDGHGFYASGDNGLSTF